MTTKIIFTLLASNIIGAGDCVLLGEFNNWDASEGIYLQKQADGSMTAEIELAAGKDYQYRYLLSNGRWINDDREKITSEMSGYPVENCIVRVPEIENKTKEVKPKSVKAKTVKPKAAAHSALRAKVVVVKHDLTKIEGVGKKIEALLHKNNINSYSQLSKASIKTIKEILDAAGSKFSMHNPATWPKQAKLAAAAKWEELELLQEQLKGGK